jgi:hypothetical protein
MMSWGMAGQFSRRMYSSTSSTACFTWADSLTAGRTTRIVSVPQQQRCY